MKVRGCPKTKIIQLKTIAFFIVTLFKHSVSNKLTLNCLKISPNQFVEKTFMVNICLLFTSRIVSLSEHDAEGRLMPSRELWKVSRIIRLRTTIVPKVRACTRQYSRDTEDKANE